MSPLKIRLYKVKQKEWNTLLGNNYAHLKEWFQDLLLTQLQLWSSSFGMSNDCMTSDGKWT